MQIGYVCLLDELVYVEFGPRIDEFRCFLYRFSAFLINKSLQHLRIPERERDALTDSRYCGPEKS